MILATVFAVAAGKKWHDEAVAMPDRLEVGGGPALLIVLRGDDCPDRKRGLERWLSSLLVPSQAPSPGAPGGRFRPEVDPGGDLLGLDLPGLNLLVVHLAPAGGASPWAPGDGLLSRLPSVDDEMGGRASRALRRVGVPGTPAFLLLDGEGRVLLGEEITEEGPGPRLALAGRVIQGLLPPSPRGSEHPERGDHGCPEEAGLEEGHCPEEDAWNS